jgi:hypothetical protein
MGSSVYLSIIESGAIGGEGREDVPAAAMKDRSGEWLAMRGVHGVQTRIGDAFEVVIAAVGTNKWQLHYGQFSCRESAWL